MKKLSFVLSSVHGLTRYFVWEFTVNGKVIRQGETACFSSDSDPKFVHIDSNGDMFGSKVYNGLAEGAGEHVGFGYDWIADLLDESDRESGVSMALFIEKYWRRMYWPIASLVVGDQIDISGE